MLTKRILLGAPGRCDQDNCHDTGSSDQFEASVPTARINDYSDDNVGRYRAPNIAEQTRKSRRGASRFLRRKARK
jgi:hypothetical protein